LGWVDGPARLGSLADLARRLALGAAGDRWRGPGFAAGRSRPGPMCDKSLPIGSVFE